MALYKHDGDDYYYIMKHRETGNHYSRVVVQAVIVERRTAESARTAGCRSDLGADGDRPASFKLYKQGDGLVVD